MTLLKAKNNNTVIVAIIAFLIAAAVFICLPLKADAASIYLSKSSIILNYGQSYKLELKNCEGEVSWKSSNESIAKVSDGTVNAMRKVGSATITASVDGKNYSCKVTVQKGVLSKTSIKMTRGAIYQIKTSSVYKPKWYSTKKSIATVTSTGKVRAWGKKGGKCYIVAKINGKKYKCKVTVRKKGVVLIVSPKSKPIGGKYMKTKAYNKYTKHSLMLRTCMTKLERSGGGTLVLKPGTYNLPGVLFVPSNVTVRISDGARVCKTKKTGTKAYPTKFSIFCVVKPSVVTKVTKEKAKYMKTHNGEEDYTYRYKSAVKKYNGSRNVKFLGDPNGNSVIDHQGYYYTFGISMGHARNVTVQDINFKNMDGNHFIEINSSNGVLVQRCTFTDDLTTYGYNSKKRVYKYNNKWVDGLDHAKVAHKEGINIDTCDPHIRGYNNPWAYHDYTPCKNITIRNCVFTRITRCIGTHKYTAKRNSKTGKWNVQVYHTNIKIYNNRFLQSGCNCVSTCNWKGAVIKNNVMDTVSSEYDVIKNPRRALSSTEPATFFSNLRPADEECKIEKDAPMKLKSAILLTGSHNVAIYGNKISNAYIGVCMFNLKNLHGGNWYAISKYSLTSKNRGYILNNNSYTNMRSGKAYFFANDSGSVYKGKNVSAKKEYTKNEYGVNWNSVLNNYSSYKKPRYYYNTSTSSGTVKSEETEKSEKTTDSETKTETSETGK